MRARLIVAVPLVMGLAGCGLVSHSADQRPTALPSATKALPDPPPTSTVTPSPRPTTLQQAFQAVRSGIVRFHVATCHGDFIGSGFEISPTLVVTVAHVVAGGRVIRVIQGGTSTAANIVGIDNAADVAVVRTVVPLAGAPLQLARTGPKQGQDVAAVGYPLGDPLSINIGTVTGLDRKAVIDDYSRHGLVEFDTATTHGSSGGPLIDVNASVVGLVDAGFDDAQGNAQEGRKLAVSSVTARPLVTRWSGLPSSEPAAPCDVAFDGDGNELAPADYPTTKRAQALRTLSSYFGSIDNGDFPTAMAQLAHPGSAAKFKAAVASSQDTDWQFHRVTQSGDHVIVWTTFTSHQDAGRGPAGRPDETCTDWSLDYTFSQVRGLWLIERTRAHPGSPGSEPCAVGD